jgi:hypothetical protein
LVINRLGPCVFTKIEGTDHRDSVSVVNDTTFIVRLGGLTSVEEGFSYLRSGRE